MKSEFLGMYILIVTTRFVEKKRRQNRLDCLLLHLMKIDSTRIEYKRRLRRRL
jgi:hypothetical protein